MWKLLKISNTNNFISTKMAKPEWLILRQLFTIIILLISVNGRNTEQTRQPYQLIFLASSDNPDTVGAGSSATFTPIINQNTQDESYFNTNSKSHFLLPDRLLADVDYFDKLSVSSHLNNKQFVDTQVRCIVYDGPCDFFGRKAKELLPSIILDNCRLCTETQKNKLSRVVVHLQQHYPGPWRDALVKYGSSPKFITAGQVVPGATFFGVVQHHKKPQQWDDDDEPQTSSEHETQNKNLSRGVVHIRGGSASSSPAPYDVNNVNPVIPTPQTATEAVSIETPSTDDGYATTATMVSEENSHNIPPPVIESAGSFSYPNYITMSSTLAAPIPVLASISATSTSPVPEQLSGVVESPPIYPTSTTMMMMNNYNYNPSTTLLPLYYPDLNLASSSSEPPSTSVVESTIEIKPTTNEPLHNY